MNDRKLIDILSENPIEQVWLYLSRLESVPLARKALQMRADDGGHAVAADVLDRKAVGVAYALRSARDYLQQTATSETRRVVATYYGTMSLLSAALIADPASDYDLAALERATKFGHGLASIDDERETFPIAQKVYVTNNGFAHRYLKHIGVDPSAVKIAQRLDEVDKLAESERARLLSLDELLARVPELASFYHDVTGRPPLSAHVFASDRNMEARVAIADRRMAEGRSPLGPIERLAIQWVGMKTPGLEPDGSPARVVDHLGIPLEDLEVETDMVADDRYWTGRIEIPEDCEYWHEALDLYRSPMCATSWFRPLFGVIRDPLFLHLATLYALSILARYRPKLWREITEGELTEYLALLRYYLAVVDRIAPERALASITGREVVCVQPGSFLAPM